MSSVNAASADQNSRRATRQRTFLPALIEVPAMGVSLPCTVRDMSDTGARIQVSDSVSLPPSFTLRIPKFDRSIRVSQKWRHGEAVGLHFEGDAVQPDDHDPDAAPDLRYVRKLEDEIARLKKLLEEIRADPMKARLLLDAAA